MFSIRRAVASDAAAIYDVHISAILVTCAREYSEHEISGWIAGKTPDGYVPAIAASDFFVALSALRIVGFSEFDPESREIAAVYVHPSYSRRGVGQLLLREAEAAARTRNVPSVHLHATLNAVPFYQAAGYELERFGILSMRAGSSLRCAIMHKSLLENDAG